MRVEKEMYELILAYLREDISGEELIRLQEWLTENERHRKLLEELRNKGVLQQEIERYGVFDTAKRWEQLKEAMGVSPWKKRSLLKIWVTVAAVEVIVFVGGLLYWQVTDSAQPEMKRVATVRINQERKFND